MQSLPPPAGASTPHRTPSTAHQNMGSDTGPSHAERTAGFRASYASGRAAPTGQTGPRVAVESRQAAPTVRQYASPSAPLSEAPSHDRSAPQSPVVRSARPASVIPPTPIATINVFQSLANKRPPDLEESSNHERSSGEEEENEADEPLTAEEIEEGKGEEQEAEGTQRSKGKGPDRRNDEDAGSSSTTG